METNCRKLVSACVQLGKTRFSRPDPPTGGRATRGRREGPGPRRGALPGGASLGRKETRPRLPAASPRGGCGWGGSCSARRKVPGPLVPAGAAAGREARREYAALRRIARVRETGVPSALPLTGSFALCPSFSPVLPPPPPPLLLSAAVRGRSVSARAAGAGPPGVQPAAVECLFSKDSEIKKVEFTDSPESRKEAASSKLFPLQHPGANGKAGSGAQAARLPPASRPPPACRPRLRSAQARPQTGPRLLLELRHLASGWHGKKPSRGRSFLSPNYTALLRPNTSPSASPSFSLSRCGLIAYAHPNLPRCLWLAWKSGPTATSVARRVPLRAGPPRARAAAAAASRAPPRPVGAGCTAEGERGGLVAAKVRRAREAEELPAARRA